VFGIKEEVEKYHSQSITINQIIPQILQSKIIKMKTFYIFLIITSSAFSQKKISEIYNQNIVTDTLIKGKRITKMNSIQKNAINDISKINSVFDTSKRHLENWNGKELVNSVLDICTPNIQNDCGGLGGAGEFPPVLSTNVNQICSSQNDINSNVISAVLTAAGCDAGAGRHVAWFNEDGIGIGNGSNHTKTITNPGRYFARCIAINGELKSGRSNYITIAEHQTPSNTPLLVGFLPIIAGNYITLQASNCSPNSYEWENIGIGQNALVLLLESTTYRAFCKNQVCRGDVSSVQVTVLQPTITSNTNEICYNSNTETRNSAILTLTNCDGLITWSTRQTSSTITVQPDETKTFFANCKSTDNVTVTSNEITINVIPKPTITKSTVSRTEFRLAASCQAGNTFLWSTGATTSSIVVPSNLTQEYTAYCIKNGCSSKGKMKKIYAAPEISSNLTTICEGQTITLSAIGCEGTVNWYSGTGTTVLGTDNPQNFVIRNILNPTVFTYRATCTVGPDTTPYSNTVSVNVNTGTAPNDPTVSTVPNPTTINLGKSISLTAAGCAKNQTFWGTGENANSISKTPEETVTYFAYCFNGTCPSTLTNKLVTVVNVPPPTVLPTADIVCAGQNANFNIFGCNGTPTLWSIPENDLDATPTNHGAGNFTNIALNENRLFYATCADQGVVSDNSEIVLVSFSPNPIITINPNPAILWEGESVELFATGCKSGEAYLWDDLVSTQTFSQIETQDVYHIAKCSNNSCTTNGVPVFVRVCPLLQTFKSPDYDFNITPRIQPEPSRVIVASNLIQTTVLALKTTVIYEANNSIILEPGFKAENGSIFTAQIGGCTIRPIEVSAER
jgi:hypothetical protein